MEKIVDICKQIKNLDHCTNCGGNHSNGICDFCHKENQQLLYQILQLEKELSKLPDNAFNKDKIDKYLTELYLIRNMDIPIVTETLNNYNYKNTITKIYSSVLDNLEDLVKNNITIPNQINDMMLKLFFNNEFSPADEMTVSNMFIRQILNDEGFNIKPIDKEKLVLKATELIATNVLGFKKVYIRIKDDYIKNKEDALGLQLKDSLYISREVIHGNPKDIFPTLFHELIHLKQYKEKEIDCILSDKNLIQIKDKILSKLIPNYYKINYKNISFEKEAFFYEYRETIDYFNGIGVNIPKEHYAMAVLNSNEHSDFAVNKNRINSNGKEIDIDELFNEFINLNPNYLTQYPQLSFEYKVLDNQVLPKTLEEIQNDYNNFQNGNLKWNGNQEEINSMYLNKMNELTETRSINK